MTDTFISFIFSPCLFLVGVLLSRRDVSLLLTLVMMIDETDFRQFFQKILSSCAYSLTRSYYSVLNILPLKLFLFLLVTSVNLLRTVEDRFFCNNFRKEDVRALFKSFPLSLLFVIISLSFEYSSCLSSSLSISSVSFLDYKTHH